MHRFLVLLDKGIDVRKLIGLFSLLLVVAAMNPRLAAQNRCGTMELESQRVKSPDQLAYEAQRELAYQTNAQLGSNKVTVVERVIPVVVHLIQQSPMELISDARVQSQIDVLNEDFRKLNADTSLIPLEFQSVATNCQIRFCLATIDPNGCPTTGINRVVAPALAIHGIDDEQALKSFVQWDPRKYLNMWVPVNLKDNLLGYATFPTWLQWAPQNDGVVINGNNFGRGFGTPSSSYNLGRTATHEVGHWLGLYHTFQDGCAGMTAQNCLGQGDRVCDTPPTSGPLYGCPSNSNPRNSCAESPVDLHDQSMNYMDYTDDGCMYMFSEGQRVRVYNFLDVERAQLWSPANLAATGCDGSVSPGCLPVANFLSSKTNVCSGVPIDFEDRSSGPATSWLWTFQGGNPATSTLQNPSVTWANPGTYAVTLIVNNGIGADTLLQTSFVTVVAPRSGPVMEGFEGLATLPLEWYTTDADWQGTWTLSTAAAASGQQSIVAHNFNQAAPLTRDELVTHLIDLPSAAGIWLTFDHAYRRRGSFVIDSLQVLVSTDCQSDNWTLAWERTGAQLATTGGYGASAAFVPQPNQWQTDSVDLSAFASNAGIRIMFRSVGGGSQDIYLDNINLNFLVGNLNANPTSADLSVFPNPAADAPSILLQLPQAASYQCKLYDLQGRMIGQIAAGRGHFGRNMIDFPANLWGILPSGLYLIELEVAGARMSQRLVKM